MNQQGGSELSDDELRTLLGLLKASDSVELKLTVLAEDHRLTIDALKLDPLKAQIRQVYFLDTPDLRLNAAGVLARVRRIQGKAADTVIKLRPALPDDLPPWLRRSPGFTVEVDAMRGSFICGAALKSLTSNARAMRAAKGRLAPRRIFSKVQRAFYREFAPPGLEIDDLSLWGPIFVLKQKWVPAGLKRAMVAEVWLYPDGSRVLELSTKCQPNEGFQVAAETRGFLAHRGIKLIGAQETKTKKALEFFAARVKEESAEPLGLKEAA